MIRKVVWSRDALEDITAQAVYIAKNNKQAALRVANAIKDAGDKLGAFSTGRPGRFEGTYEKSLAGLPYIIVYALTGTDAGEATMILRVIHTSQDWPKAGRPEQ